MPLNKANTDATQKFEDGKDWLVLRTVLNKGQRDLVGELQQNYRFDPAALSDDPEANRMLEIVSRVADTNALLFEILAVDWSLDEDCTRAAYQALDAESGEWVDRCIQEVLAARAKRAEKKPRSSARRESSRRS